MSRALPRIADIKRAVAAGFDADPAALDEPDGAGSRARERVRPRQVAMTLSLTMTRHTSVRIGQFFSRDHATVLHARKATNAFLLSDADARDCTRKAIQLLRGEAVDA